ncbi:hypothetical protein NQ318_017659 [Aromia moschata]|uniref:Farnesol dehydrogenase n=1 Tax=Aromia moschata TaxID=1265417 RepID=A0AAV8X257_9CUCU|nr:hypothetical protein NQ318_017659 [Aromia moschata]
MVLSMDRWIGKVAVVTGANAGIGAAIAERLVEEGLKTSYSDANGCYYGFKTSKKTTLKSSSSKTSRLSPLLEGKTYSIFLQKKLTGKEGKLYTVKADVSKEEDILKAFVWIKENVGPVHILVNNAGSFTMGNLSDGDTKAWENVFKVTVLGLCIATREAIKDMKANGVDGHIIHINGITGHQVPNIPGMNVAPASKYAVTALAETLRLELNATKSKIKITSISPGLVRTEMIPNTEFFKEVIKGKQILDPEDIADGIVYVLSTPPHVLVQELTIRPVDESSFS